MNVFNNKASLSCDKFIINWFAHKKKNILRDQHSEGHFLPWVPLCEKHPHERLSQPLSPSAANLTRRQFAMIWNSSSPSLGTISSAQQTTKEFCLNLSNLTHNNGTFLDTRLIHIFVKERLTFATIHNKVWLPVPTYSLSNMWYIMCGDDVLKIDVKKTLENGGENGMIEESAITISHSARPGVCLSFQIAPLFFLFFLCFLFCFVFVLILNRLLWLDKTSAIWPNLNLSHSQGVLFLLYTWCFQWT